MWRDGRGLAIDVAVINPLLHMGVDNPCEEYATAQKHRKYDSGFAGSRYFFAPVVFETSGGVNAEGEEVIKQIFRFASARSGSRHCVFAGLPGHASPVATGFCSTVDFEQVPELGRCR